MPHIIFALPNGTERDVVVDDGVSVMKAAVSNMVPGIIGECGGDLSCATCHVFIDEKWIGELPERSPEEEDMLEATSEEPTDCSRLGCQVAVGEALDGIVVHVPETQR